MAVLDKPDTGNASIWWHTEKAIESGEFHQESIAWVQSLGLDPNRIRPRLGVCRYQGKYELHFDELVEDSDGRVRQDPLVANELLSVRRVVVVEEGSWPEMPEEADTWA